jgi:bacterioferritin
VVRESATTQRQEQGCRPLEQTLVAEKLAAEGLPFAALYPRIKGRSAAATYTQAGHARGTRETTMPADAMQKLIDGLNQDLQGEFQAIIMYRLYASLVQGPYRQELRAFFANEIPEEMAHAQILADKIAALGGTPASTPAPVEVVKEPKAMLETALRSELEAIERYLQRRKQAEEAGEFGLAVQFDSIISDETNHRDELRQILARWPD